jgi:hypothetical protein
MKKYVIKFTQRLSLGHGEGTDYYYRPSSYEFESLSEAKECLEDMQQDCEYSDIFRNF